MTRITFDELPDESRLWVFPADRGLKSEESARILAEVDAFLQGWKAHGAPLRAGRDWRYDRFLLVAVDHASVPPSGCSIDALVRTLKGTGKELGISLLDHAPVWYRDGEDGKISSVSRAEFQALAEEGEVGPETVVFDHTLTRLRRLREGKWECPARESWHGRAFF